MSLSPPDPQQYHSGGEGITKLGGTDWNVDNCTLTLAMEAVETTTTADFDTLTKMLYANHTPVKASASGTANFYWDSLNPPDSALNIGNVVPLDIAFPGNKTFHADRVLITGLGLPTGGMGGVYSVEASWVSKGKFLFQ